MTIPFSRNVALLLVAGLSALLAGCRRGENEFVPPPPAEVTIARPLQMLVTPFIEKNGETEAVAEAEVSSRVSGFVQEINFQPGQDVEVDDLLYKIEPDQYQAAVNSAKAEVAAAAADILVSKALVETADAELKETTANLGREKSLFEKNAGSQAEYDRAIAANDSAKAAVKQAEANVTLSIAGKGRAEATLAKAELDLGYTNIRAAIKGRISKTEVKKGNLVENGSAMASIVNNKQIFANFSLSDREVLQYMDSDRGDRAPEDMEEIDWRKVPVYLRRESDKGFPFVGNLEFVDTEGIDVDTGTLGMRAQFANPNVQLLPGMFVSVRLPIGKPAETLLIPEYAIGRDQRGLYVLTVDDQQIVQRSEVSLNKAVGGWALIESGITTQSRVVIEGVQRARPGLEVAPSETELAVDDQTLLRGLAPSGQIDQPGNEASENEASATESSELESVER